MDAERLHQIVLGFAACRVAVVGDFFLDKYLDVDSALAEVSLETGRTAHQVASVRCSPGAAGTVVNNLVSLGAGAIHPVGFTGDDGEGYELRRALEGLGCHVEGLPRVTGRRTPTYLKPRDLRTPGLSGEHDRYDTKNRTPTPAEVEEQVLDGLDRLLPRLDAVIAVDQVEEDGCGVVTARVRSELARVADAHPRIVFWADSRRRIGLFRNVMVKVNAAEALRVGRASSPLASAPSPVEAALLEIRRRAGRPVFVTAGEDGTWVSDPQPTLVPAVRLEGPMDPTGAGDSATAGAVLALCSGATLQEAALVANLVASITVQQLATTGTASASALAPRLETWRRQRAADR